MKGLITLAHFSQKEQEDIIATAIDVIKSNDWNADKAKQEVKRTLEQADTVKDKKFVYSFFSQIIEHITHKTHDTPSNSAH